MTPGLGVAAILVAMIVIVIVVGLSDYNKQTFEALKKRGGGWLLNPECDATKEVSYQNGVWYIVGSFRSMTDDNIKAMLENGWSIIG